MKKCITIVTLICFVISSVIGTGYASAVPTPSQALFADILRSPAMVPALAGGTPLPDDLSPGAIINIQDLHCHEQTQRNIARILSVLDKKYSLPAVYIEGAAGAVDTSWIGAVKDAGFRKGFVESLMRQGKLTGAEYYAITSERPRLLKGIEDKALHRENLRRLGVITGRGEAVRPKIEVLRSEIERLEERHLNRRNKRFDDLVVRFKQNKVSPEKYYTFLFKYAQQERKQGIAVENYPVIAAYLKTASLAKKLRPTAVNREIREFLREVRSRMNYRDYRHLTESTGNLSDTETLAAFLGALYAKTPSSFDRYPHLRTFIEYRNGSAGIRPLELLEEERELIDAIRISNAQGIEELEVLFLSGFLNCFEDFLLNRLTGTEYGYFTANKARFDALWEKYGARGLSAVKEETELLAAYYAANDARNLKFIENLPLGRTDKPIVLVTGGFHSEGLKKLCKDKNIPFYTVTPAVTGEASASRAIYTELVKQTVSRQYASPQADDPRGVRLSPGSRPAAHLALVPLSQEPVEAKAVEFITYAQQLLQGEYTRANIEKQMRSVCDLWNSAEKAGIPELVNARRTAGDTLQFAFEKEENGVYYFRFSFPRHPDGASSPLRFACTRRGELTFIPPARYGRMTPPDDATAMGSNLERHIARVAALAGETTGMGWLAERLSDLSAGLGTRLFLALSGENGKALYENNHAANAFRKAGDRIGIATAKRDALSILFSGQDAHLTVTGSRDYAFATFLLRADERAAGAQRPTLIVHETYLSFLNEKGSRVDDLLYHELIEYFARHEPPSGRWEDDPVGALITGELRAQWERIFKAYAPYAEKNPEKDFHSFIKAVAAGRDDGLDDIRGWFDLHRQVQLLEDTDRLATRTIKETMDEEGKRLKGTGVSYSLEDLVTVTREKKAKGDGTEEDYVQKAASDGQQLFADFVNTALASVPADSRIRLDKYMQNQAEIAQAIAELLLNAQDASMRATGRTAVGKMGVGAYQMFGELKNENDHIVLESFKPDLFPGAGEPYGVRFVFWKDKNGVYRCAFEIVEGTRIPGGTRISVRANIRNDAVWPLKKRRDYIAGKMGCNTQGPVYWGNGRLLNEQAARLVQGDVPLRNGAPQPAAMVLDDGRAVFFDYYDDGYIVIDNGTGMGCRDVLEKFLVPNSGANTAQAAPATENEAAATPAAALSPARSFYEYREAGTGKKSVSFYVYASGLGHNLETIEVPEGYTHVCDALVIGLPKEAVAITIDRSTLRLEEGDRANDRLIAALKLLIDTLADPRVDLPDRFEQINSLAVAFRQKQGTQAMRLLEYLKERLNAPGGLIPSLREKDRYIVLPNTQEFSAIAPLQHGPEREVVYLDAALFDVGDFVSGDACEDVLKKHKLQDTFPGIAVYALSFENEDDVREIKGRNTLLINKEKLVGMKREQVESFIDIILEQPNITAKTSAAPQKAKRSRPLLPRKLKKIGAGIAGIALIVFLAVQLLPGAPGYTPSSHAPTQSVQSGQVLPLPNFDGAAGGPVLTPTPSVEPTATAPVTQTPLPDIPGQTGSLVPTTPPVQSGDPSQTQNVSPTPTTTVDPVQTGEEEPSPSPTPVSPTASPTPVSPAPIHIGTFENCVDAKGNPCPYLLLDEVPDPFAAKQPEFQNLVPADAVPYPAPGRITYTYAFSAGNTYVLPRFSNGVIDQESISAVDTAGQSVRPSSIQGGKIAFSKSGTYTVSYTLRMYDRDIAGSYDPVSIPKAELDALPADLRAAVDRAPTYAAARQALEDWMRTHLVYDYRKAYIIKGKVGGGMTWFGAVSDVLAAIPEGEERIAYSNCDVNSMLEYVGLKYIRQRFPGSDVEYLYLLPVSDGVIIKNKTSHAGLLVTAPDGKTEFVDAVSFVKRVEESAPETMADMPILSGYVPLRAVDIELVDFYNEHPDLVNNVGNFLHDLLTDLGFSQESIVDLYNDTLRKLVDIKDWIADLPANSGGIIKGMFKGVISLLEHLQRSGVLEKPAAMFFALVAATGVTLLVTVLMLVINIPWFIKEKRKQKVLESYDAADGMVAGIPGTGVRRYLRNLLDRLLGKRIPQKKAALGWGTVNIADAMTDIAAGRTRTNVNVIRALVPGRDAMRLFEEKVVFGSQRVRLCEVVADQDTAVAYGIDGTKRKIIATAVGLPDPDGAMQAVTAEFASLPAEIEDVWAERINDETFVYAQTVSRRLRFFTQRTVTAFSADGQVRARHRVGRFKHGHDYHYSPEQHRLRAALPFSGLVKTLTGYAAYERYRELGIEQTPALLLAALPMVLVIGFMALGGMPLRFTESLLAYSAVSAGAAMLSSFVQRTRQSYEMREMRAHGRQPGILFLMLFTGALAGSMLLLHLDGVRLITLAAIGAAGLALMLTLLVRGKHVRQKETPQNGFAAYGAAYVLSLAALRELLRVLPGVLHPVTEFSPLLSAAALPLLAVVPFVGIFFLMNRLFAKKAAEAPPAGPKHRPVSSPENITVPETVLDRMEEDREYIEKACAGNDHARSVFQLRGATLDKWSLLLLYVPEKELDRNFRSETLEIGGEFVKRALSNDKWDDQHLQRHDVSRHEWIRLAGRVLLGMDAMNVPADRMALFVNKLLEAEDEQTGASFETKKELVEAMLRSYRVETSVGQRDYYGYLFLREDILDLMRRHPLPLGAVFIRQLLGLQTEDEGMQPSPGPEEKGLRRTGALVPAKNTALSALVRLGRNMTRRELRGEYNRFYARDILFAEMRRSLCGEGAPSNDVTAQLLFEIGQKRASDLSRPLPARPESIALAREYLLNVADTAREVLAANETIAYALNRVLAMDALFASAGLPGEKAARRRKIRSLLEQQFPGAFAKDVAAGFGRYVQLFTRGYDGNTREDDDVRGKINFQERVLPVWLRELVQNSRDAIKTDTGLSGEKEVAIQDFVYDNRWYVCVQDPVGMSLDTLIKILLTPDETTKTVEKEVQRIIGESRDRPVPEVVDRIMEQCVKEERRQDAAMRAELAQILQHPRLEDFLDGECSIEENRIKRFMNDHGDSFKRLYGGLFGMGFFTVFGSADEVLVRSGRNGKVYEIRLRPLAAADSTVAAVAVESMHEYGDPDSVCKGTEIRRIKHITPLNQQRIFTERAMLALYAGRMLGGIDDCAVTYNKRQISDGFNELVSRGEATLKLSGSRTPRLSVDRLYVTEPAEMLASLPEPVREWYRENGANIDFSKEVQLESTRNNILEKPLRQKTVTPLALQGLVQLWKEDALAIEGIRSFREFMAMSPAEMAVSQETVEDGRLLAAEAPELEWWERYRHDMKQFEKLLWCASFAGMPSAYETKMEAYYRHVPAGLREINAGPVEYRDGERYAERVAAAHLVAYVHDVLKGKPLPRAGNEGAAIAEEIARGNLDAVRDLTDANWQSAALHLTVPELGCSLSEIRRKPAHAVALAQAADMREGQAPEIFAYIFRSLVRDPDRVFGTGEAFVLDAQALPMLPLLRRYLEGKYRVEDALRKEMARVLRVSLPDIDLNDAARQRILQRYPFEAPVTAIDEAIALFQDMPFFELPLPPAAYTDAPAPRAGRWYASPLVQQTLFAAVPVAGFFIGGIYLSVFLLCAGVAAHAFGRAIVRWVKKRDTYTVRMVFHEAGRNLLPAARALALRSPLVKPLALILPLASLSLIPSSPVLILNLFAAVLSIAILQERHRALTRHEKLVANKKLLRFARTVVVGGAGLASYAAAVAFPVAGTVGSAVGAAMLQFLSALPVAGTLVSFISPIVSVPLMSIIFAVGTAELVVQLIESFVVARNMQTEDFQDETLAMIDSRASTLEGFGRLTGTEKSDRKMELLLFLAAHPDVLRHLESSWAQGEGPAEQADREALLAVLKYAAAYVAAPKRSSSLTRELLAHADSVPDAAAVEAFEAVRELTERRIQAAGRVASERLLNDFHAASRKSRRAALGRGLSFRLHMPHSLKEAVLLPFKAVAEMLNFFGLAYVFFVQYFVGNGATARFEQRRNRLERFLDDSFGRHRVSLTAAYDMAGAYDEQGFVTDARRGRLSTVQKMTARLSDAAWHNPVVRPLITFWQHNTFLRGMFDFLTRRASVFIISAAGAGLLLQVPKEILNFPLVRLPFLTNNTLDLWFMKDLVVEEHFKHIFINTSVQKFLSSYFLALGLSVATLWRGGGYFDWFAREIGKRWYGKTTLGGKVRALFSTLWFLAGQAIDRVLIGALKAMVAAIPRMFQIWFVDIEVQSFVALGVYATNKTGFEPIRGTINLIEVDAMGLFQTLAGKLFPRQGGQAAHSKGSDTGAAADADDEEPFYPYPVLDVDYKDGTWYVDGQPARVGGRQPVELVENALRSTRASDGKDLFFIAEARGYPAAALFGPDFLEKLYERDAGNNFVSGDGAANFIEDLSTNELFFAQYLYEISLLPRDKQDLFVSQLMRCDDLGFLTHWDRIIQANEAELSAPSISSDEAIDLRARNERVKELFARVLESEMNTLDERITQAKDAAKAAGEISDAEYAEIDSFAELRDALRVQGGVAAANAGKDLAGMHKDSVMARLLSSPAAPDDGVLSPEELHLLLSQADISFLYTYPAFVDVALKDPDTRLLLLQHDVSDPDVIRRIADAEFAASFGALPDAVMDLLLANEATPADVLADLYAAYPVDNDALYLLAMNPNIDEQLGQKLLAGFLSQQDASGIAIMLSKDHVSRDVFNDWIARMNTAQKEYIACHADDPYVRERMSGIDDQDVRAAFALRDDLSAEEWISLAQPSQPAAVRLALLGEISLDLNIFGTRAITLAKSSPESLPPLSLEAAEILARDPLAQVRTALLERLPHAAGNPGDRERIETLALALSNDKVLETKKAEASIDGLSREEEKAFALIEALREQSATTEDFTDSERIHAIELALAGDEDMAVRAAVAARGDLTAETEKAVLAKEFTRQMFEDIIRHTSQQDLLILFSGMGNTPKLLTEGHVMLSGNAQPDSVFTRTMQDPKFMQLLIKSATLDGPGVSKVRLAEAMLQFYGSPVLFSKDGLNPELTQSRQRDIAMLLAQNPNLPADIRQAIQVAFRMDEEVRLMLDVGETMGAVRKDPSSVSSLVFAIDEKFALLDKFHADNNAEGLAAFTQDEDPVYRAYAKYLLAALRHREQLSGEQPQAVKHGVSRWAMALASVTALLAIQHGVRAAAFVFKVFRLLVSPALWVRVVQRLGTAWRKQKVDRGLRRSSFEALAAARPEIARNAVFHLVTRDRDAAETAMKGNDAGYNNVIISVDKPWGKTEHLGWVCVERGDVPALVSVQGKVFNGVMVLYLEPEGGWRTGPERRALQRHILREGYIGIIRLINGTSGFTGAAGFQGRLRGLYEKHAVFGDIDYSAVGLVPAMSVVYEDGIMDASISAENPELEGALTARCGETAGKDAEQYDLTFGRDAGPEEILADYHCASLMKAAEGVMQPRTLITEIDVRGTSAAELKQAVIRCGEHGPVLLTGIAASEDGLPAGSIGDDTASLTAVIAGIHREKPGIKLYADLRLSGAQASALGRWVDVRGSDPGLFDGAYIDMTAVRGDEAAAFLAGIAGMNRAHCFIAVDRKEPLSGELADLCRNNGILIAGRRQAKDGQHAPGDADCVRYEGAQELQSVLEIQALISTIRRSGVPFVICDFDAMEGTVRQARENLIDKGMLLGGKMYERLKHGPRKQPMNKEYCEAFVRRLDEKRIHELAQHLPAINAAMTDPRKIRELPLPCGNIVRDFVARLEKDADAARSARNIRYFLEALQARCLEYNALQSLRQTLPVAGDIAVRAILSSA